MSILDNFIYGGWRKKAPATNGESLCNPILQHHKVSENLADTQANTNNNIDILQRYQTGEYLIRVGALEYAPANDILMAASLQPAPQALWGDGLVYENEVTCLYSDSNTGKSILSVQIGNDIAKQGKIVLYVDFELSLAQFRGRYTNDDGEDFEFSPNFLRCNASQYASVEEDTIITNILQVCADSGAEVIIIDNLTWIDSNTEKGDAAVLLMKELVRMKQVHNLTVIVISHTPKRDLYKPITQNDLSGSKKIMNFVDAAITIGKSIKDPNLRYIKQIKVRSDAFKFDADNVLICELTHGERGNYLHFEPLRTAPESELLKAIDDETRNALISKVKQLHAKGKSNNEISRVTGISKTSVFNYLRK